MNQNLLLKILVVFILLLSTNANAQTLEGSQVTLEETSNTQVVNNSDASSSGEFVISANLVFDVDANQIIFSIRNSASITVPINFTFSGGTVTGITSISLNTSESTVSDTSGVSASVNGTGIGVTVDVSSVTNGSTNFQLVVFDLVVEGTTPCIEPDVPTVVHTPTTVCNGNTTTLNITGSLNDATEWVVYTDSCGGSEVGRTTTGSLVVTPTAPNTTYYVRGEGGCVTPDSCGTTTVTVTPIDDASFSYGATAYCQDATDPTPTITGLGGGAFSSTAGLSINSVSGLIDVSASTPNTYTVTYTTAGTCPSSSNVSVTINAMDDASFSYASSSYTIDGSDPSPTITGVIGGTFSSTSGLSIASNGVIDLSASAPDTYTVTYTTAGTCPNSSTFDVTINYSTYTWTGNIDNNWEQSGNWNTNAVPHATGNVIIPSGLSTYPTATAPVSFGSMTMNSGATFIPESSVSGIITYNRNLPTTNWYLISMPVSGENAQDIITNHTLATGTGSNIGLSYYSNNIPGWGYATSGSTGAMTNGMGFSVKLATAGDLSLTGAANVSNVNLSISTGTGNNFNLLGNPFTAYINSATFTSANTALLSEETIWLWNGSTYVTYNALSDVEIAPVQAFFVEAATGGTVTFATSNRSHQASDTFMRQVQKPSFELSVSEATKEVSTKVFFVEGKTTGFDNGYDSKLFGGITSDFTVFTELLSDNDGRRLAIQALPNENIEDFIIPVGLIAEAGKEINFSVNTMNLPSGIQVYLEDRLNNEFINLSEQTHKVVLNNASNGIGQFYLHTTSERLSSEDIIKNISNVSIYKSAKQEITIAGLQAKATVNVYSLLGKELVSTSINSNGVSKINLPSLSTGIYIVKVNSDLGEITKKIILE
ncbi:T9SS type A sorting domain-containing protein [Tenacibaculum sp. IB213877]|uniref:T9SS type A sorting domain-containing protein n=1 Tax=Tenacibaculum sp. IB213877 TaxID=3097351 RepID=UPI002A59921C|nr:T9SS type A sorting domain-containing protein [Tenacibaculum sp. IB213877]MDY0780099.1 T9SS type A sorting domain-containing protein [Tenacibaculum sp. IB213877]